MALGAASLGSLLGRHQLIQRLFGGGGGGGEATVRQKINLLKRPNNTNCISFCPKRDKDSPQSHLLLLENKKFSAGVHLQAHFAGLSTAGSRENELHPA